MPVISSFADLKKVSKDLKKQAKAREEERKKQALAAGRSRREAKQFEAAMAEMGVRRMKASDKADTHRPKAEPIARQNDIEKRQCLEDSLSDGADPLDFLESEDGRLFRRAGVSPDIPRKLYRGEWTIEAHLDLHGLRVDEAREAVVGFLKESRARGYRCLRIVHGKGYGSEGGRSVLKEMVPRWLKQRSEVMAFVQTPPADGDSGALRVLIRGSRH